MSIRSGQRQPDQLRSLSISRHYTKYAEGSVLIALGETKVICTASIIEGIPYWRKEQGNNGWLTAEYGMLPRSTHSRIKREATQGRQSGRTLEIQRLIGRTLRTAINLEALGKYTIHIDCDVIQADGGTRTAAITGSCVALVDAITYMQHEKLITIDPLQQLVAAISVGIYDGMPILDLDYSEDSQAETDMNVVMTDKGEFIELQGTAETTPFSHHQLDQMLGLAQTGIGQLIVAQREALVTQK